MYDVINSWQACLFKGPSCPCAKGTGGGDRGNRGQLWLMISHQQLYLCLTVSYLFPGMPRHHGQDFGNIVGFKSSTRHVSVAPRPSPVLLGCGRLTPDRVGEVLWFKQVLQCQTITFKALQISIRDFFILSGFPVWDHSHSDQMFFIGIP